MQHVAQGGEESRTSALPHEVGLGVVDLPADPPPLPAVLLGNETPDLSPGVVGGVRQSQVRKNVLPKTLVQAGFIQLLRHQPQEHKTGIGIAEPLPRRRLQFRPEEAVPDIVRSQGQPQKGRRHHAEHGASVGQHHKADDKVGAILLQRQVPHQDRHTHGRENGSRRLQTRHKPRGDEGVDAVHHGLPEDQTHHDRDHTGHGPGEESQQVRPLNSPVIPLLCTAVRIVLEERVAHSSQDIHLGQQKADGDGQGDAVLRPLAGNNGVGRSHDCPGQIVRNGRSSVGGHPQRHQLKRRPDGQAGLQISQQKSHKRGRKQRGVNPALNRNLVRHGDDRVQNHQHDK